MASILTEIRQAMRRLAGNPAYSASIFLMLALGIALSVGMYTVLNGVLLKGLPYPGGERVVEIAGHNAAQGEAGSALTAAEAFALADVPEFEQAGWYVWGGATVLSGERPREITINNVSAGYFAALGVRPQLGRWINESDIGPERQAVVLSDIEWERLANRDPGIIGQPLRLADGTVTVAGVMPPDFATGAGLWRAADPAWYSGNPAVFVNARYVNAVGRLAEGVDAERAHGALDALAAQLRDTHSLPDNGWRMRVTSLLELMVGDVRAVLAGVFIVSLVVLAIACANVGSLLAARLASRERELAIVQALGATSGRIWRGLVLELLLLASMATAAAVLLLHAGLNVFRSMAAGILPRAGEITLDVGVLAFAAALALLCPLLVAIPLGLRLRKRMAGNLHGSGKGADTIGTHGMRALPLAGLALATTASIAGTAVALSLDRLRAVDPGFRTENIYAVQLFHGGGPDEWRRFSGEVLTRMRSEPDIETIAMTTAPPLASIGSFTVDVQVSGRQRPEPLQAGLRRVSPGYLDVMGQSLLRGRNFGATDDVTAPKVAIVNETLVQRVFPDADPLGRDIGLPLGNGPRVQYRIVGVVADIRNDGLRSPTGPEILIPFMQSSWVGMTFLAHAPHAGAGLLERMQEAVWAVDPTEAMTRVYRLRDEIDEELSQVIFFTRMLGGFALVALLLAAFGTYSVIAFLQRRRTTEIGVRLALGARPLDVARRVLGQGLVLALFAGVAGSLAAIAVLRLLGNQLYGVGTGTPMLYAFGIGGVLLGALLASTMPALRAARVQPMAALRHE